MAFDFSSLDVFNLFGSKDTPPPVSRSAISYSVTIDVAGGDSALVNAVRDASSLWSLRQDAPPDGEALARRAMRDFVPVIDALWGDGYYNATVTISIDRASLDDRLERHRGLRARRRKLSQPRGRADRHQGRARPAVQAALDPRPERRPAPNSPATRFRPGSSA